MPPTIIMNAAPFRRHVFSIRSTIWERFENNTSFKMSELFGLAPIRPADEETKKRMSERPAFVFFGDTATSTGKPFVGVFSDEDLGRIEIKIPAKLTFSRNGEIYSLESVGENVDILMPDLVGRFGNAFVLGKLVFNSNTFEIWLTGSKGGVLIRAILDGFENTIEMLRESGEKFILGECCCAADSWNVYQSRDFMTRGMCTVDQESPGMNWVEVRSYAEKTEADEWVANNCKVASACPKQSLQNLEILQLSSQNSYLEGLLSVSNEIMTSNDIQVVGLSRLVVANGKYDSCSEDPEMTMRIRLFDSNGVVLGDDVATRNDLGWVGACPPVGDHDKQKELLIVYKGAPNGRYRITVECRAFSVLNLLPPRFVGLGGGVRIQGGEVEIEQPYVRKPDESEHMFVEEYNLEIK